MDINNDLQRAFVAQRKDHGKLVMLGVLHMAQYFPIAFTGVALPFIFRQEGLPLEMFWLLALPGIPRGLKWLMALAVDNYGNDRIGRRKSWIIPCTVVGTLAYALLALIPPSLDAVHLIVAILVFSSFVMAAQDIAVDAYAAESMNEVERPTGVALINFLAAVAGVLGTGAVALVELYGWSTTMLCAAGLMLFAATPAVLRKEPPPPQATQKREQRGEKPNLLTALKRRDSYYILPFLLMFGFGGTFFVSMLGPFWADKGLTLTEFGILSPIAALAGSGVAAVLTPWLIAKIGMRNTAIFGISILPIEAAIYSYYVMTPELPALPILIFTISLLAFSTNVYVFAVTISRFRWVSKAQAGTDYALQSSIWNIGVWAAGSVSGFVAASFGWIVFFPLAALAAGIGGLFYILLYDKIEQTVVERENKELELEL